MFGTKMVRVGNFDALEPIKYHRSSRPIIRRADEEPGRNLDVRGSQVVMRLGQQKMLEGPGTEEAMSEVHSSCLAVVSGAGMEL